MNDTIGIVLAAGAGRRMGGPKALIGPLAGGGHTPLAQVCRWVHAGGCECVIAVIGARADSVRAALAVDPGWTAVPDVPPGRSEAPEHDGVTGSSSPSMPEPDPNGPASAIEGEETHTPACSWPGWLTVIEASDWAEGMGASLRAGLGAAQATRAAVALITLVDLPDVREPVYARILGTTPESVAGLIERSDPAEPLIANSDPPERLIARGETWPRAQGATRQMPRIGPNTLARASYHGDPGHPVLIGRDLWGRVIEVAEGDQGARSLFATMPHDVIECGDLATGQDADHPE